MAKRTLGKISDEIFGIKLKEKKLKLELKELEEARGDLEAELRKAAETQGLMNGGGLKSEFNIEEKTVPAVADWDKFYEFIAEENYFHLIQRRPAEKACQELWELGRIIPGVDKFTFVKVSVKETK